MWASGRLLNCNIMSEKQLENYNRIHFAVMAIEASARKAHLSGKEMHDRLKRQGLIRRRLLRHYEQLHTQSLDWVANDTLETLQNWEREEAMNERQCTVA